MKSKKLIEKNYAFDKNSSKDRETKLQKQLADLYKENNDQGEEIFLLAPTTTLHPPPHVLVSS